MKQIGEKAASAAQETIKMHSLPKLIIGIEGFAKTGKDFYGALLEQYINDNIGSEVSVGRLAFADELKKETDPFLQSTLGISAFTSNPEEKKMIRPFLVFWGTNVRRKQDDLFWVKQVNKQIESNRVQMEQAWRKAGEPGGSLYIPYVTDVRYPNEADWVLQNGGILLSIRREGVLPPNEDEEINGPLVRAMTPYKFDATTYENETEAKIEGSKEFYAYLVESGIHDKIIRSRTD